ncbi:MAG: phosphate ABC transporter substrate-binding protein [Lachnospiraceae bacterium]
MKNRTMKLMTMMAAVTMTAALLAGCGSAASTEQEQPVVTEEVAADAAETPAEDTAEVEETAPAESSLSGSVTMVGSTSMEKFANALSEVFMQENPGVTVSAEFVGSSAGIEALLAGTADIGNSSRNLKDSEKEGGAVENIVALDGIAVVTDPANTVADLTKDQLISVFKGEIKNWADLGGESQPIVVIGRESGSGTRGAFEELLEIEDVCAYANELDSTGAVMAKVASTPGAIGYVSLDVVDDSVKKLTLEGVEASEETIKAGDYFLSRPFVMATKGEIAEQNEAVQALFTYLQSDAGKELIKSVGLITVD